MIDKAGLPEYQSIRDSSKNHERKIKIDKISKRPWKVKRSSEERKKCRGIDSHLQRARNFSRSKIPPRFSSTRCWFFANFSFFSRLWSILLCKNHSYRCNELLETPSFTNRIVTSLNFSSLISPRLLQRNPHTRGGTEQVVASCIIHHQSTNILPVKDAVFFSYISFLPALLHRKIRCIIQRARADLKIYCIWRGVISPTVLSKIPDNCLQKYFQKWHLKAARSLAAEVVGSVRNAGLRIGLSLLRQVPSPAQSNSQNLHCRPIARFPNHRHSAGEKNGDF